VTSYADTGHVSGRRARRREKAEPRRPLAGGVAWIAVLATLLAGVVAVNVAVLRLTMRLDRTNQQRTDLQADIARLQAEISSVSASVRIQQQAQAKLGVVQADPSTTTYVTIPPR
jgi:cell division protein FtsL